MLGAVLLERLPCSISRAADGDHIISVLNGYNLLPFKVTLRRDSFRMYVDVY